MSLTYKHLFQNGKVITCTVIFLDAMVKIDVDNANLVTEETIQEYIVWSRTVIMPDVLNRCTPQQLAYLTQIGENIIQQQNKS